MKLAHSYSSIKLYENCPLRYYRQRVTKDVVDEGGEASRYGDRIHKFLEKRLKEQHLEKEIERYEPLCKAIEKLVGDGELFVELELTLTETLEQTHWWANDAWLRSKVDVLVIVDDKAYVFDWKTGKRRPDKFQMQLFAAQVFKNFPDVNEVKTTLLWLQDMSKDTDYYTRADSNKIWSDVLSRIRRIYDSLEHEKWPARPSGLCRFCPARHDCDFAQL